MFYKNRIEKLEEQLLVVESRARCSEQRVDTLEQKMRQLLKYLNLRTITTPPSPTKVVLVSAGGTPCSK